MDSKKEYPHKATSWLKRLQEKDKAESHIGCSYPFLFDGN